MSASKPDLSFSGNGRLRQALGHSLRIELLFDLLEDGSTSPSRFVEKHGLGEGCLSQVSYHLEVLEKSDVVVLKERIPRRGGIENVYQVKPAR